MKSFFTYSNKILHFEDDNGVTLASFPADSYVRNELNGERKIGIAGDVAYQSNEDRSMGVPIMPRPFPIGECQITGKETTTEKWLQPVKFITDAHMYVDEWEVGPEGYIKKSGTQVMDWGRRIHFNNGSKHTEGCISADLDCITWMDDNIDRFPIPLVVRETDV